MSVRPGSRITGIVKRVPGRFCRLTGGNLSDNYQQQIDIPHIIPEDQKVLSALFTALRILYPYLEWDKLGVEIVEGHDRIVEYLPEDFTILIERQALGQWALLSWELMGTLLRFILLDDYDRYLTEEDASILALSTQCAWFAHERIDWQKELLESLLRYNSNGMAVYQMLCAMLSRSRYHDVLNVLTPDIKQLDVCLPSVNQPKTPLEISDLHFYIVAKLYLYPQLHCTCDKLLIDQEQKQRWEHFRRAFAINSHVGWGAFLGTVPGIIFRYTLEVDATSNSSHRRLNMFRIVVSQQLHLDEKYWNFSSFDWVATSLLILDAQRHPKITKALLQYLTASVEYPHNMLWPISADEHLLAQISARNKFNEEDERFFRQATHIQVIWRDILHRTGSQEWASDLLFDALEHTIQRLRTNPELFLIASIGGHSLYQEPSAKTLTNTFCKRMESDHRSDVIPEPLLQNLQEFLWIMAYMPMPVLNRLYPRDWRSMSETRGRWAMLRRYIRRFLHLAPSNLKQHFEQLKELPPLQESAREPHFHVDSDPDIPHQELYGRILPLLSRPELKEYRVLELDKVAVLRIVCIDRYFAQSSGLSKEQRFFRSFILFFKTTEDREQGGWLHFSLWLDKEIDLSKFHAQQRDQLTTIENIIHEEGIWQQTYRYQFLSVDQLMSRLKPNINQWREILHLLGDEYKPLFIQRLREMLDYHYYSQYLSVTPPNSPGIWLADIDIFENAKTILAEHIAEQVLYKFYNMLLLDKCSWTTAHQLINQLLHDISELCLISPKELIQPNADSLLVHHCFVEQLYDWNDELLPASKNISDEEQQLEDKHKLFQLLYKSYTKQGVAYVRLFIEQFAKEYSVKEILISHNIEDSTNNSNNYWTPVASSLFQSGKLIAFLTNEFGKFVSPVILHAISQIPQALLKQTLEIYPELFYSLQKAAKLLKDIDKESEQNLLLWNTIEDMQRMRNTSAQKSSKDQIAPDDAEQQKSSTLPD